MIGPLANQLGQMINQVTPQIINFLQQELSKPHNQIHICKAIGEIIKKWK